MKEGMTFPQRLFPDELLKEETVSTWTCTQKNIYVTLLLHSTKVIQIATERNKLVYHFFVP